MSVGESSHTLEQHNARPSSLIFCTEKRKGKLDAFFGCLCRGNNFLALLIGRCLCVDPSKNIKHNEYGYDSNYPSELGKLNYRPSMHTEGINNRLVSVLLEGMLNHFVLGLESWVVSPGEASVFFGVLLPCSRSLVVQ